MCAGLRGRRGYWSMRLDRSYRRRLLGSGHTGSRRSARMDDGRRLAHGAVDWRRHVQVGRNHDRRDMGLRLELARRHGILRRGRRWLLIRVPLLLHRLHVLGIAVGRAILLEVMVGGGVGVVVHGRVCLGRHVVVVVLLLLPSARHIRAGHHERYTRCCLHSRRRLETKQPTCEATGRGRQSDELLGARDGARRDGSGR
jgi:hypothetical protein